MNRNITPIPNKSKIELHRRMAAKVDPGYSLVAGTTKHLLRQEEARFKQALQKKNLEVHLRDRSIISLNDGSSQPSTDRMRMPTPSIGMTQQRKIANAYHNLAKQARSSCSTLWLKEV